MITYLDESHIAYHLVLLACRLFLYLLNLLPIGRINIEPPDLWLRIINQPYNFFAETNCIGKIETCTEKVHNKTRLSLLVLLHHRRLPMTSWHRNQRRIRRLVAVADMDNY